MSVSVKLQKITGPVNSKNMTESVTVTGDGLVQKDVQANLAKAGTLTTRTDDDDGVITMGAGHGFVDGDRLDIFWDVGGVKGSRYGITADMTGDLLTVTGGAGDVLPADESPVTVCKCKSESFNVIGNNMQLLSLYMSGRGNIIIADAVPAAHHPQVFPNNAQVYQWYVDSGITNPLAGDTVTQIFVSQASTTTAADCRAVALVN